MLLLLLMLLLLMLWYSDLILVDSVLVGRVECLESVLRLVLVSLLRLLLLLLLLLLLVSDIVLMSKVLLMLVLLSVDLAKDSWSIHAHFSRCLSLTEPS